MVTEKHIFAVHIDALPHPEMLIQGRNIMITDTALWHRVYNVLHLHNDEQIIIFDTKSIIRISLTAAKKGIVGGVIISSQPVAAPTASITLYQSLLKREAFEDVAYYAAQMGVNEFVPVVTGKTQRSWGSDKDGERLTSVMIAACEQAKQYSLPHINRPIAFNDLISSKNWPSPSSITLYADPNGQPLLDVLNGIAHARYHNISIFVGPEGGFTGDEVALLNKNAITGCALTRSILRSQEAAAVFVGALRSIAR